MAITVKSSGTVTTDGTEQTMLDTADLGAYVLSFDTANMVNGDRIRIKITRKILTGSTAHLVYDCVFEHAQGQPIIYSPAIPCPFGAKFTIQREAGTDRTYDWSVCRLDA